MKKRLKQWMCVWLSVMMLAAMLCGCGVSEEEKERNIGLVRALIIPTEEVLQGKDTSVSDRFLFVMKGKTYVEFGEVTRKTVELTVTMPDMNALFSEQLDEEMLLIDPIAESNRILENVTKRMEQDDCPMITTTVTAEIDQSGDQPEVVITDELINALSGNLLTLQNELLEQTEG